MIISNNVVNEFLNLSLIRKFCFVKLIRFPFDLAIKP